MHLVLLGIGLAVAGLLGALTLNRRGGRPEQLFLAGWLSAYGAAFLGWILAIMLEGAPALLFSAAASSGLMLTPPFAWMYAKRLAGARPKPVWPHFLPAAFNFMIIVALWRFSAAESVDGAVMLSGPRFLAMLLVLPSLVILAMCAYAVLAWRIAGRQKAALKDARSDESVAAFDWVRVWAATTFVLLLAFLASNLAVNLGLISLPLYMTVVFAAIAVQIAYVAYHGLKENAALGRLQAPSETRAAPPSPDPARAQKLEDYMASEKPYLDPSLTVEALASGVGWDRAEVTAAIRRTDASFFDYVNRHRVKEAKRLLSAPENASVTVLAIGLDVGFGSKSAFNAAFKKATGLTPTQYRASDASLNG